MPKKFLTHSFITALAVLFIYAPASAQAGTASRRETIRAHHHNRHKPHNKHLHGRKANAATTLLGDEALESNKDNLGAGQAEAFPFPVGTSGTTGAAHIYVDYHTKATTLITGLYSDQSGHPYSLLTTGSLTAPHAGAWNTVTMPTVQLVPGSTYWLVVLGTGGTLHYRDQLRGPCKAETSRQTNLTALAGRWSTGSIYTTCPVSGYVSREPSPLSSEPLTPVPPVTSPEPPPPPVAPVNTVLPVVSGVAEEGKTLTATTGTWTGSPTSYTYQWQQCDPLGESCTNIGEAAASSYKLTASDVGSTVRVVVSATNAGGTTQANSTTTTTIVVDPPPPPPTASFTYSPASPVTGQAVTFDGTSSTCSDGPCTYEWSDDGGTTQPIPALWPLGSGQTLSFTFSGTGTKYVRLVVTDAAGQTATVEHNVVVEEPAPPPPVAPINTASPTLSGKPEVGQTLSTSNGTWSGDTPISYAYQWRDCDTAGESCSNIGGATASSYKPVAGDVGHTLRVVVSASNAGGSTQASSAATATVVAEPPPPPPPAPVNTALPSLSGSAVEGETLKTTTGTWTGSPTSYGYQWQDCNTSGQSCSNIGGAVSAAYRLVSSDVGHTVRVVLTATNAGGATKADSTATATVVADPPPPPVAPVNTVLPAVSGVAEEGKTLTTSTGTWNGSPTSYTYQWQQCDILGESCTNIGEAAASSYKLTAGDVGSTVRVVVSATNAGGTTQANSTTTTTIVVDPPPAAPVNIGLPAISGAAEEGQTLSASNGTWTESPTSYTYQWEDCDAAGEGCSAISGASASTYTLTSSDVGHALRVVVSAANEGGSTQASSAATSSVLPVAPTNISPPTIAGSVIEGATLTAEPGIWTGSPTSFTYQWEDCGLLGEACAPIAGATGSSYALGLIDLLHTLRVAVTATNAGGSTTATSATTGTLLPPAPTNTAAPSIAGSAVEGETLKAATGSWSGSPTSYAYQWQDCNASGEACTAISGASGATYHLLASDVGHTLRVLVSASNAGGSGSASSAASATVLPAAPANTTLPAVSGTAVEGETLKASTGSWSGSPTSFTDQWQDCNSSGEACAAISAATGATYHLLASDVGHRLRVVVTASNSGGSTPATSAATAVVTAIAPAAPVNSALPVVSGSAVEGQTLTTTNGTWAGSPTSYAYQWQDCNTSGSSCANINSATATSYKLTSSDVGHTLRVVVSASNAGGSTPASSAATTVVSTVESTGLLVGSSTVETEGDTSAAGSAEAFQYTASTSGTVHSLSLYVNSGSSAPAIVVGLYSDASGNPGTLLASATISSPAVGAWNAVGVSPVAVSSGSVYWLAALAPSGTLAIRDMANGSGGPTQGSASGSLSALPSSWSSGASWANSPASFYASGEVVSPPPAPTNTVLPSVSGSAVERQTLSASNGTWSASPSTYAYQWQDCNSLGASCANISGATGSSYTLLANDVGHTLRVVVTASNAGGSTPASSAASATVAAGPPPVAPTNTAPPTIAGSAVEGQTLSASSGTWTEGPTSYAYQWEDCNAAGEGCSAIAGASASARVLASSDVGHTLRVVVRASNSGGTGEALSPASSLVTLKKEGTPTNCFPSPEGCGYPGPNSVGVQDCSALPKTSGTKTITKSETIENTNITGYLVIDASGVTLNHDCVVFNGGEAEGSAAVVLEGAASNFTISNTTVRGENTTSGSFEEAIRNNHSDPGATATKDRLEDCAECIHQSWTLEESYVTANGRAAASGVHTEDWWFDNNTITANDDTLLNPERQTAVIFAEASGACENHEKVTNSLIAGGGFMFYFCTHASSIGRSTIEIKNNRFARRVCTKSIIEDVQGRGGWECSGNPNEEVSPLDAGEGTDAFHPRGGFFGVASESPETFPSHGGAGWEGNYWDDNLAAQADETP